MRVACACGIYLIEANNATYVRNGVPLCNEATCQKVREHRNLRRVPFADEDVPDMLAKRLYPDI